MDTRGGGGLVTYGTVTYQGHSAFCVDWPQVGYYSYHTDKLNDFQLLLVNRSDAGQGDFDIVFNYGQIQWETGDASGGSGGLGGTSAGAGFSNGDGLANHFFQVDGSLQNGAFLDSNAEAGLVNNAYGSTVPGRYVFHVTGTGGSTGGLAGLQRDWPSPGYGYQFHNQSLTDFEIPAGMSPEQAFSSLSQTFADWERNAAQNGGTSRTISQLNGEASGLCFGLALSGGRFDSGIDLLSDPLQGRSDPAWASAAGALGALSLPAPGAPETTSAYNQQFLGLIARDWATQFSTQVNSSLQLQHYAYADPTTGFGALQEQLESVMRSGVDKYGPLWSGAGNGFAMITLQTIHPQRGHEVLAYSAEPQSDGGLQIDVWDNNFPRQHYAIHVNPDLSWTYPAPYSDGTFQGNYSMAGEPGHSLGVLAVLPLYSPTGLSFYPHANGGMGTGSLVDISAGATVQEASDSAGTPVDVEPVITDGVADGGAVIDFPSSAGQITLTGSHPSLDVRGAATYMTLDSSGPAGMSASEDAQAGSISSTSNDVQLSVARGDQVATSSGAGGLTFGSDGSISTSNDSDNTTVQVQFMRGGELNTATLYSGAAQEGGTMSFSASQIQAAESPPGNTTRPSISGTATEQQTLTESHGTWTDNPSNYSHQWERCDAAGAGCAPISAAAASAYTLQSGDVGHTIRVAETASNAVGASDPAVSDATAVVRGLSTGGGSTTSGGSTSASRPVVAKIGIARVAGTFVRVPVSCAGPEGMSCKLAATLTVLETIRGGKVIAVTSRGTQRRTVILARAGVALASGQARTIALSLSRTGKRLLAARHVLRVKLTVAQSGRTLMASRITFKTRRHSS